MSNARLQRTQEPQDLRVRRVDGASFLPMRASRKASRIPPIPGDFESHITDLVRATTIQAERNSAAQLKACAGSCSYLHAITLQRLAHELVRAEHSRTVIAIFQGMQSFDAGQQRIPLRAAAAAYARVFIAAAAAQFKEFPPEARGLLTPSDRLFLESPKLVDVLPFLADPWGQRERIESIVASLASTSDREKQAIHQALSRAITVREFLLIEGDRSKRDLDVLVNLYTWFAHEEHRSALPLSDRHRTAALLTRHLGRVQDEKLALRLIVALWKLYYGDAEVSIAAPFVRAATARFPSTEYVANGWLEDCELSPTEMSEECARQLIELVSAGDREVGLEKLRYAIHTGDIGYSKSLLASVLAFLELHCRFEHHTSTRAFGETFQDECVILLAEIGVRFPALEPLREVTGFLRRECAACEILGYPYLVEICRCLGSSGEDSLLAMLGTAELRPWAWNTAQHLNDGKLVHRMNTQSMGLKHHNDDTPSY